MKAIKTFCREAKISISPWGVNFQFSVRDEKYVSPKKSHPRVNLTSPTCTGWPLKIHNDFSGGFSGVFPVSINRIVISSSVIFS